MASRGRSRTVATPGEPSEGLTGCRCGLSFTKNSKNQAVSYLQSMRRDTSKITARASSIAASPSGAPATWGCGTSGFRVQNLVPGYPNIVCASDSVAGQVLRSAQVLDDVLQVQRFGGFLPH